MGGRYCEIPECENPSARSGLCWTHMKRKQRGASGAELAAPIAEKKSLKERLLDAIDTWAEADDEEEYRAAERTMLSLCRALGRKVDPKEIREGMEAARARGVHVGRPRALSPEQVQALAGQMKRGTGAALAAALGVSERTLRRARRRSREQLGCTQGEGGSPVADKRTDLLSAR